MPHKTPTDLTNALCSNTKAMSTWQTITPLAKNEWVCWIISAKKTETRDRRIKVGIDKLQKGMRRPCCWAGCPHREKNK